MFRAAALLAIAASAAPQLQVADPSHLELFRQFAAAFNRIYSSEAERAIRRTIFIENLAHIAKMRLADAGSTYSHLTPFADWSVEEFRARNALHKKPRTFGGMEEQNYNVSALPTEFDWRQKGAVNPIKNQQQCGSCWAFASVANIEGVNQIATGKLLSLSEQELVDCDKATGDQGCHGGLPSNAFEDMIQNKIGLETEGAYPYTAEEGVCVARKSNEKVFISSWTQISKDEDQIAAALMVHGPLAIGINAQTMQFYDGGIADPRDCDPAGLDHGVAIVGFGEEDGKKYWTIRNSWGTGWGEEGYYRIVRGKGACGLNTDVATAVMSAIKNDPDVVV